MAYRNNGFRRSAPRRRRNNRRNRRPRQNLLSRPLYRLSNRSQFRPRAPGFNSLTLSSNRRLVAYPSSGVKPSPDKPAPASSWWLDGLKWLGSTALQLIGTFVAGSELEEDYKLVITGAGTRIPMCARKMLTQTAVATFNDGSYTVPFEQAKMLWIRVRIIPIVDAGSIGGCYTAALVPMDANGSIDDMPKDFDSISRQPGSVIRCMTKPISISWSPSLVEHSIEWTEIGDANEKKNCVTLCLAFSDMALSKADPGGLSSTEYNPGKAAFEVYIEGSVQVRQPGYASIKANLEYSDPTVIQVHDMHSISYVNYSDVKWMNGVGHVDPSALMKDLNSYIME